MSDKSPLFISSLELIAHATDLFAQKNEKKYKFVILHLANAIELILKDWVIDQGLSIYQGNSQTINIWECFKKLESKNIAIPEKSVIELLIDDRNTIQHRFGYPNSESVYYYLDQVVAFFQRFLNDHYGVKLSEALGNHLSKENLQLLGLVENEQEQLAKLYALSPDAAIVQAYNQIEKLASEMIFPDSNPAIQSRPHLMLWQLPAFDKLMIYLEENGFVSKGVTKRFSMLRDMRNRAAHSAFADTPEKDKVAAFEISQELIVGLQRAKEEGYSLPINSETT